MATATKPKPRSKPKAKKPDPLQVFVELEKRRRELEAELATIKKNAASLGEKILDEWAERGQNQAKVNGLTVYSSADFWCSKKKEVDSETVCKALRASGLRDMVKLGYAAPSIRAWVKERLASGSDLPKRLEAVLNHGEQMRLKTRKS